MQRLYKAWIAIWLTGERRYDMIRRATAAYLRPEKKEQYCSLHRAPWPEVLEEMTRRHHTRHSVYCAGNYLFQYLEYTGEDFAADMEAMGRNPVMQRWWALCRECVVPLPDFEGRAWTEMEEIFHND